MKYSLPFFLCVCLILSGCGIPEGPDAPAPTPGPAAGSNPVDAPPAPREGGTLRLAMRAPFTLNPLLNEDVTVDRVLKLIFEPLTILDERLKPKEHLASFNFSSDNTFVILTLKNDAIWSDGTPVTADDLLFSIETLRGAPEGAVYKHSVDNFAACEKLDNKTVKVNFVEIFGGSAYLFNFPVVPQHYYRNEKDPGGAKNMHPLGNGLFLFESYEAPGDMLLTQSPYSFRGRAYIETVAVKVISDAQTELHAFNQGLIDVLHMEITEWSRQHSVKQTRFGEYDTMLYEFIGFNFRNPLIRHSYFREAAARALDADSLVPSLYLDHAARAYSPVNPASWLYGGDLPAYGYDRDAAAALMALALADAETGGEPWETPVLRVLVNEENFERVKTAEALAEALAALGLETKTEKLPFAEFNRRLEQGAYDLFVGGYRLSVIPDLSFAFHSGGVTAGSNILHYTDPALDRLLSVAFSSATENAYGKAMADVQRRIAEDLPVISLAFRKSAVLADTRIQGEIKPAADNVFANINEWFLLD